MFNRILIKLSGEALLGEQSKKNPEECKLFDDATVNRIIGEIKELKAKNVEITLVIGGGNIWRGKSADSKMDRSKADEIGMLATVINALYMAEAIRNHGEKCIVMTPFVVGNITISYNRDLALSYIKEGYVIIFAGGLGHPYFSTDTIASIRAAELSCECILYAKNNIDGIYNKDPNKNKDAIKYNEISYNYIIENNLQAIDISAMNICNEQKIYSIAFDLLSARSLIIATENTDELFKIGTRVNFN